MPMPVTGSKSRCTIAEKRRQRPKLQKPPDASPSSRNFYAVIRSTVQDSISAATDGSRPSPLVRKRNTCGTPIRNTAAASSGLLTASAVRKGTSCLPRSVSILRFLPSILQNRNLRWHQFTQNPAADKTAGTDVSILQYKLCKSILYDRNMRIIYFIHTSFQPLICRHHYHSLIIR